MNRTLKTLHSRVTPMALLIFGGALLFACALPNPGGGAAGLGNETAESASTEPPLLSPPAATPIPAPAGHIAFISDRDGIRKLYLMNADGTDQRRLTDLNSEDSSPRWSPDGKRIAFVSSMDDNSDIYIYNLILNTLTRLTDDPAKDSSPSWSPDGSQIVFESFRDSNWEIYVVNADGSNPVRLTDDPAGDNNPIWSPDGTQIAFVSNRYGNSDILLIDPDGNNVSTLTQSPVPDSDPAWSPDGQTIAYRNWLSNDQANICIIGRNGLNMQCIVQDQGRNGLPVWSPDGRWLAFHSERGGSSGIDVINLQTRQLTSLATGQPAKGDPAWLEDVRLAYQADAGGNMEIFMKTVPTDGDTLFTDGEIIQLTSESAYDGEPHWTSN